MADPHKTPATETQMRLVHRLIAEREHGLLSEEQQEYLVGVRDRTTVLTMNGASKVIDALFDLPKKDAPKVHKGPLEDGMYRRDGVVYKVQIAVHGSGRPYAKKLCYFDSEGYESKVAGDGGGWKFTYAPGEVSNLKPEHKMSLEEAQEFGRLYGVCCRCGAPLTDEDSIAAGIGPICATKF